MSGKGGSSPGIRRPSIRCHDDAAAGRALPVADASTVTRPEAAAAESEPAAPVTGRHGSLSSGCFKLARARGGAGPAGDGTGSLKGAWSPAMPASPSGPAEPQGRAQAQAAIEPRPMPPLPLESGRGLQGIWVLVALQLGFLYALGLASFKLLVSSESGSSYAQYCT